jgi:hypothetical protein
MRYLLLLPFAMQAALIFTDEWCFHIKRGLPKWERIGHPLDTLSVLSCLVFILLVPFSKGALAIYITLALASSLLITKDEFVHKDCCCAKEMWLHAALFVNHTLLLLSACLIWISISSLEPPSWSAHITLNKKKFSFFLKSQVGFITLFAMYQIIYWNFIWKEKKAE